MKFLDRVVISDKLNDLCYDAHHLSLDQINQGLSDIQTYIWKLRNEERDETERTS